MSSAFIASGRFSVMVASPSVTSYSTLSAMAVVPFVAPVVWPSMPEITVRRHEAVRTARV